MRRALLALLALVALAAPVALPAPARAEPVRDTVQRVLSDGRYRFCHEDDYPLAPDEHAWCPIVGETSDACPSLPKACKLPPVPRYLSSFHRKGRHGARGKSGGAPVDHGPQLDDRRRPADWSFHLPDLSGFARVLFVVMIAAFVVLVGRALVQNVLKNRGDPERKDDAPPPDAPGEAAPAARGPVETDVERLLARARAAAEHGDYGRAVDDCYAALLRRLDGDGLIEIHPSRTNGDYVRALGDRPDLKGAVKDIVRDVEGVQFGDTAPSEPLFRSVLARVVPLVSRALALAVVFLGLSVALSCTPHDGGGSEDEGRSDTSPSGTQALVEVFGQHGVQMRRRSEPLSQLDRPLALVLLPEANLDEAAWKDVLAWVKDKGGHLVLAGVHPLPAELEQHLAADTDESTAVKVSPGVRWPGHLEIALPPGPQILPDDVDGGVRVLEGPVLIRNGSTVMTERSFGAGKVVIVADERLFTNAALVAADDATFALAVLYRSAIGPDRDVELCDAWTGAGAQTPMESVSQAHLTPVVLQLFALVGLLFLWRGRAFARLRDPPAEGRRAFADHARALGVTYERAHAARHVTGLYAVWALERLRERVHRAGRQGLIPLAEAIAARTGRPEGEVMSVLAEAAGARDEAAPPSSFRGPIRDRKKKKDTSEPDLKLMRELQSFLEATGSRRARDK